MNHLKILWLVSLVFISSGCSEKPADEAPSTTNIVAAQSEPATVSGAAATPSATKSTALFSAREPDSGKMNIVNFETITNCIAPSGESNSLSVVATNSRTNPDAAMSVNGTSESAQLEVSMGQGKDYSGEGAIFMQTNDGTVLFKSLLNPTPDSTATESLQFSITYLCG